MREPIIAHAAKPPPRMGPTAFVVWAVSSQAIWRPQGISGES